jgi:hypothetical protein
VGHSSGGYFAAWIAGRHHLPAGSPLVGRRRSSWRGWCCWTPFSTLG